MGKLSEQRLEQLTEICKRVRRTTLRAVYEAQSGHPGGSLSQTELLTVLYFEKLRHHPQQPDWPERDMVFLSKGHAAPGWYAVMAESGYFDPEEVIHTFRRLGGRFQGHPSNQHTPGVDISSGSLGQGLSVANGVALAAKLEGSHRRAYCMIGDGELEEGQIWEAAMTAGQYHLDNVCAMVDWNKVQLDDRTDHIKTSSPLEMKWESFGWHVIRINGHDLQQVSDAFDEAAATKNQPTVILADTVKGKGVSFMEDTPKWHGLAPTAEELEMALKELA